MEGFMKGIAFVLASLLFLEACAGAVASQPKRVSSGAATAAEKTSDSTAPSDTQTSSARWPWFVAGGAVLAAAAVGLVFIIANGAANAAGKAAGNAGSGTSRGDRSGRPITVAQSG
jgi:hypothetical protein